jgi:hypothetical protein
MKSESHNAKISFSRFTPGGVWNFGDFGLNFGDFEFNFGDFGFNFSDFVFVLQYYVSILYVRIIVLYSVFTHSKERFLLTLLHLSLDDESLGELLECVSLLGLLVLFQGDRTETSATQKTEAWERKI